MVSNLRRGKTKNLRLHQLFEEEDGIIGRFLFEGESTEETKYTIQKFWTLREKMEEQ